MMLILFGLLAWTTNATAAIVYSNDFETAVGAQLSSTSGALGIDTTPANARHFLGRADASSSLGLNNETVTLTLNGLGPHTSVQVDLSLFILQSWDGNNSPGPDVWQAGHSASLTNLQNTTFAVVGGFTQCFPSDCPASNPARTGADEPSNSLGYGFFGDSVYNLSYTFAHTGPTLVVTFTASGLQDLGDESWGIDNLIVSTNEVAGVPEPTIATLVGLALVGLAAMRRNRRSTA
jgi:hypothetical protein